MADCFLRGFLRTLFCTDTTFEPEDTFKGRIIILNLPVKEYNELGQFAQVLFQIRPGSEPRTEDPAGISRSDAEKTHPPGFLLWADESQFFANSYDALFQSTAAVPAPARFLPDPNLPSYLATFSGANRRAEAEAFLGTLARQDFPRQRRPYDE